MRKKKRRRRKKRRRKKRRRRKKGRSKLKHQIDTPEDILKFKYLFFKQLVLD